MLNKMMGIGHLGNDAEMRYTQSGQAVANFNIALSEKWKDKDGNPQEHTEWFKCVFWGRAAEIVGQYAKKGGLMYVSGSLRMETWEDKDNNTRTTPTINVREFQFLQKPKDSEEELPFE